MSKTIASVKPAVRPWQSSYGPMESVDGYFDDGDEWSINCKQGNGDRTKAELAALAGKHLDGYTIEANIDKATGQQRQYQGHLKWNLKKIQQQGGGGGGGGGGGYSKPAYVPPYRQDKEAFEREQASIHRSVALQQAVAYAARRETATPTPDILTMADSFAAWLSKAAGGESPDDAAYREFAATLKATNEHRKAQGVRIADSTAIAEAIALRQWTNKGFKSWDQLPAAIGVDNLKRLTRAMDIHPLKFEHEAHITEEAAA